MSNSDGTSTGSSTPSSGPVNIIRVHTSRQARVTGQALQTLIDNYRVPYNGAETVKIVGSEQVQLTFELLPEIMRSARNRPAVHPRNANYIRMGYLNRGTRVFNNDLSTGMFADLPTIPFASLGEEFPTPTPPVEVQVADVERELEHSNVYQDDCGSDTTSEYHSIINSAADLENSVWSFVGQDHPLEEGHSDDEGNQKSRSGSLSDSDDNKSDVTIGSRDGSGTASPTPSGNVERLTAAFTSFSLQTATQSFRTIHGSLAGMLPLALPFSSMTSPQSSSASSSVVGTATAESDPGCGDYFSGLGDEDYDHLNVEELLASAAESTPFLAVWIEEYASGNPIITVLEVNDANPAHPELVVFIRMKTTVQSIDSVKFYHNSGYLLTKVSNAVGRTRPGYGTALDLISIPLKPRKL